MKSTVTIGNLGEVDFVRSKRARKMSIIVKPFSHVRVTIPERISLKVAEKFVAEKYDWIIQSKLRVEAKEKRYTIFTENSEFSTKTHKLNFNPINTEKVSIEIKSDMLTITYPYNVKLEQKQMQDFIRKGIVETLKIEAKSYLPNRVKELANFHGFRYKRLTLRNNKTRWGSCSHDNNLNLNIHLMRLPNILIDYVIIHELCHTIEKNHGRQFWALVEQTLEYSKTYDKQLKNYNPHIY